MPDIIESPKRALHELRAMAADRRQATLLVSQRVLDGTLRDVEMHLSPITVRGNHLLYAILHDVTERLVLEKELRRAEQLESLGLLAGGIAHDFNNFLASMIGNLQLAQLDVDPKSQVAEALGAADGACRRAQDLARQLLTFTKRGAPVRQPTGMADLLHQTVRFASTGSAAGIDLDLAPDLSAAVIDEGQISQVLHNLVINATQALPQGGTIRVSAHNRELATGNALALAPGRYVHIRVQDNGPGIPPEDLDRIFQPYFTTKKGGSGLGLATSYSIARKHEGTLTVESSVGRGTTFHVHLPAAAARPRSAPVRPSSATTGGERILWLEDDPAIASVVERMLARYGYDAEIYPDGADICKRFQEARDARTPFDLVVLDLTIPGGMGGRETIQRLQRIDPRVRAVACSGSAGEDVRADVARHGFCAMLGKPFTRETLAAVLIDALDEDQRASEAA
jgi:signal transduction histidine kinase/CheY-like chemotaxis protein